MNHRSSGFALLTVVMIAVGLSAFAILALQASHLDSQVALGLRKAESTLMTAEGGLNWAIDQLHTAYPTEPPDMNEVISVLGLNAFEIAGGDLACPSADCQMFREIDVKTGHVASPKSRWFRMTSPAGELLGDGRFHAAIRKPTASDEADTVQIRVVAWPNSELEPSPATSRGPVKAIEAVIHLEKRR